MIGDTRGRLSSLVSGNPGSSHRRARLAGSGYRKAADRSTRPSADRSTLRPTAAPFDRPSSGVRAAQPAAAEADPAWVNRRPMHTRASALRRGRGVDPDLTREATGLILVDTRRSDIRDAHRIRKGTWDGEHTGSRRLPQRLPSSTGDQHSTPSSVSDEEPPITVKYAIRTQTPPSVRASRKADPGKG